MKSKVKAAFLAMALLLHAGLLATAYIGLNKEPDRVLQPPLTVSIIPPSNAPAETAMAPLPPLPAEPLPSQPATLPSPKKVTKSPAVVRKQSPRSAPTLRKPEIPPPAPQAPAATPAEPSAPDNPSPLPSRPAVPVKTDVGIPASYAATNRKPEYPALSRRYGEQGTVLLRVFVREDGTAGEIQLKTSSGFPLLDKSAINAVKDWRFNPATLDGKPIAEWYQVPIPFKLEK
jgi:protein TonB